MSADQTRAEAWGMQGTKNGPHSNHANVGIALAKDPVVLDGVYYDAFRDQILHPDGRLWTDADDTRVTMYLQEHIGLHRATISMVSAVIVQRLQATPRHCVREFLLGLKWDGDPYIDDAFCRYWHAVPTPNQPREYLEAASRNFFLALVARALTPPDRFSRMACQVDEMVVFESAKQGLYKSSALATVGYPWYQTIHERITDKDFLQAMQGVWLIEVSELEAFSRAQVERVKSVITTRNDWYRGSYDHRTTAHPRQCNFAGTSNRSDWGHDDTGLRRFVPVVVSAAIDIPDLESIRDQLLAEAVHRVQAGEPWHLYPASTTEVQGDRQAYDEWSPRVLTYAAEQLHNPTIAYLQIVDILTDGLKLPIHAVDKATQMRVARILTLNGWDRRKRRSGTDTAWVWFPPEGRNSED